MDTNTPVTVIENWFVAKEPCNDPYTAPELLRNCIVGLVDGLKTGVIVESITGRDITDPEGRRFTLGKVEAGFAAHCRAHGWHDPEADPSTPILLLKGAKK